MSLKRLRSEKVREWFDTLLAVLVILKYVGYALFFVSLMLIVALSFFPLVPTGWFIDLIMAGITLIIIGHVPEMLGYKLEDNKVQRDADFVFLRRKVADINVNQEAFKQNVIRTIMGAEGITNEQRQRLLSTAEKIEADSWRFDKTWDTGNLFINRKVETK